MIGQRQEMPRFKSVFYQKNYHKILRWLIVNAVIIFILMLTIIYFIYFPPTTKYYATTTEGLIVPMTPD